MIDDFPPSSGGSDDSDAIRHFWSIRLQRLKHHVVEAAETGGLSTDGSRDSAIDDNIGLLKLR